MAEYRLFLLDEKAAIQARHEFVADDDVTALTLSNLLWQVCNECYRGYELWCFDRRLVLAPDGTWRMPPPALDGMSRDVQQQVLDREEALQRSHWRVAKSRKLLDATAALRDRLDGKT